MLQAWQNWEMKNLIFVIKLWYLTSLCLPALVMCVTTPGEDRWEERGVFVLSRVGHFNLEMEQRDGRERYCVYKRVKKSNKEGDGVQWLFVSRLQSVAAAAAVRCHACTKDSRAVRGEKCFVISAFQRPGSSECTWNSNWSTLGLTFIIAALKRPVALASNICIIEMWLLTLLHLKQTLHLLNWIK